MTHQDKNYRYHPNLEYRYFVHDPQGDTLYFKSAEERNSAAEEMVATYLQDGWEEGVDQIVAGEITHHVVAKDVQIKPAREAFETEEDFQAALDDYPHQDFDFCCSYVLADLSDKGEELPK